MFIASLSNNPALQRSAMCFRWSLYVPLLTERNNLVGQGYKHFAPPEQGPPKDETDFWGKA